MANCINCGQEISTEQTTCPYCGAAQQFMTDFQAGATPDMQGYEQQQSYAGQYMQQGYEQQQDYDGQYMQAGAAPDMQGQRSRKKHVVGKIIGICAGVVAVLALALIFVIKFIGAGAPTQKAAIKSYVEAILNENLDDYLDVCYSKELLAGFINKYGISDTDFKDEAQQMLSGYAEADNIREIKIIDKHKMNEHEIESLENKIMNEHDAEIKISELVRVEYEYEAKQDGEWKKDSDVIQLYKTNGKWFVVENLIIPGIRYNGIYELTEVSTYGMTVSIDQFGQMVGHKAELIFIVNGNKCTISGNWGGSVNRESKITFSGNSVTILNGDNTMTGKYDDSTKTITITMDEVDLLFKKR